MSTFYRLVQKCRAKNVRQFITESVFDFMKKLIVHTPENGKHNIRYYGFYANKSSKMPIIRTIKWPMYSSKVIKDMTNELLCDRCGKTLVLVPDMCYIPKKMKRKRSYG